VCLIVSVVAAPPLPAAIFPLARIIHALRQENSELDIHGRSSSELFVSVRCRFGLGAAAYSGAGGVKSGRSGL
jgi:hypothetical protein